MLMLYNGDLRVSLLMKIAFRQPVDVFASDRPETAVVKDIPIALPLLDG